jgi:tRNA-Thr(GGU) m(6)t(6)A37 methyltransferase TsaA
MTTFAMKVLGRVRGARAEAEDDFWGGTTATIELAADVPAEALEGLDAFSHAEVLFVFDRVTEEKIVHGARHPRNNLAWPRVGIFAQRGKNRPNRIGSCIVRVVGVEGRSLRVAELDAIEGTPVIDIKPVMREFLPRTEVRQPAWATELMGDYWKTRSF